MMATVPTALVFTPASVAPHFAPSPRYCSLQYSNTGVSYPRPSSFSAGSGGSSAMALSSFGRAPTSAASPAAAYGYAESAPHAGLAVPFCPPLSDPPSLDFSPPRRQWSSAPPYELQLPCADASLHHATPAGAGMHSHGALGLGGYVTPSLPGAPPQRYSRAAQAPAGAASYNTSPFAADHHEHGSHNSGQPGGGHHGAPHGHMHAFSAPAPAGLFISPAATIPSVTVGAWPASIGTGYGGVPAPAPPQVAARQPSFSFGSASELWAQTRADGRCRGSSEGIAHSGLPGASTAPSLSSSGDGFSGFSTSPSSPSRLRVDVEDDLPALARLLIQQATVTAPGVSVDSSSTCSKID